MIASLTTCRSRYLSPQRAVFLATALAGGLLGACADSKLDYNPTASGTPDAVPPPDADQPPDGPPTPLGWTWVKLNPPTSPSARQFHAMAYDAKRKQTVLFGGWDDDRNLLSDTWIWNGTTWSQANPQTSPPARAYANRLMVYDAAREELVLFGGNGGDTPLGDTWTWNGSNWTQKQPATSPAPSWDQSLAYDATNQEVVLFGLGSPAETWVWDGSNWTKKHPTEAPGNLTTQTLTYDAARGQVILFGGFDLNEFHRKRDTWAWDGENWTRLFPPHAPVARSEHSAVYHEEFDQIIMFGGSGEGPDFNDTWQWDGTTWTQLLPVGAPNVRAGNSMSYDAERQEVVLFGGGPPGNAISMYSDTWVLRFNTN